MNTLPGTATIGDGDVSSLQLALRALRPLLESAEVTEICINRPGEAFVERRSGWTRTELPFADFR